MGIKEELKYFYNHEAKKYYTTRKKHRSDGDLLMQEIKKRKGKIAILEVGCGGGRFLDELKKHKDISYSYTGIDLSQNLIELEQKDHPNQKIICADMMKYIKTLEQESVDVIIGTASIQHLPSHKERIMFFKYCYRALTYGGQILFINRSFSDRFIKKYKGEIFKSFIKYIISGGKRKWNDILIPWHSKNKTHHRFYHIFTLKELKKLATQTGFVIQKIGYLNHKGNLIGEYKKAKNTILIAKKEIS